MRNYETFKIHVLDKNGNLLEEPFEVRVNDITNYVIGLAKGVQLMLDRLSRDQEIIIRTYKMKLEEVWYLAYTYHC